MRKFYKNDSYLHGSNDSLDQIIIQNEEHPSKISGSRVRQAVEKFRDNDLPPDKTIRRSSIPISKTRTRTTSVDSNKGTYRISRRSERSSIDVTFDKIFADTAVEIDKIDDKLNEIVTDIEDADSKFEMVAKAYDTNAEKSIVTEKKQSKIPIKRFTSHHEKSKFQNIDRRHSVHTNVDNNIRKLSRKKINNIDNLNELIDGVDRKKQKEPVVENVSTITKADIKFEPIENEYDDLRITVVPHKKENNKLESNTDDQNVPKGLPPKVQSRSFDKFRSKSIDVIEDLLTDEKGYQESYVPEHNGEIPSTKDIDIHNSEHMAHYEDIPERNYEKIDNRPVLSKIALFEQKTNLNPKTKAPSETKISIETTITKEPQLEPEIKYIKNETLKIEDLKTSKIQIDNANAFQSIEKENKGFKDVDTKRLMTKSEIPFRKSKSSPNIDSGGTLSYQKQRQYNRLSSVEKLVQKIERNNKMCPIHFKEMPRKKSVSEKIALFEGKLSQNTNDQISNKMVESIKLKLLNYAQNADKNVQRDEIDASYRKDPYATKVEELKSAKLRYGSMKDVKYIELNNGKKMPVIALGTALLEPGLIFHIITAAIDLGYRAFDTAYIDGNEREIGEAIQYKIRDGTVTRGDLFIINKLWSTFHRTDLVERACLNSLETMQLEYFDLYLIHNPMSFKEGPNPIPKIANVLQYSSSDYLDAWFGMEKLVYKGLVKSIGVSNFNSIQLARIVEKGKIAPVVNQVESHPYLSQVRLQELCSVYNVLLQSYGVLGSTNHVIVDSLVRICAAGMNVEPSQTLIRFQLDMDRAVVVKASTAEHLWTNLQSTEIKVNPVEMQSLHALNINKRLFNYKGLAKIVFRLET